MRFSKDELASLMQELGVRDDAAAATGGTHDVAAAVLAFVNVGRLAQLLQHKVIHLLRQ